ncbi:DUF6207 family protein [Streptomyces sp. NPDC046915]|uniref:DUF6207 family protein n=1 Tax=Streptomyces sp. NPDC046915 TaxID=3155257 RepID=UPI0033D1F831
MGPINETHVSEPGLMVVDVAAADDVNTLAFGCGLSSQRGRFADSVETHGSATGRGARRRCRRQRSRVRWPRPCGPLHHLT